MAPAPVCVKLPAMANVDPLAKLTAPLLVMLKGPEPVVVTLWKFIWLPERTIPLAPDVVNAPLNVATPPIGFVVAMEVASTPWVVNEPPRCPSRSNGDDSGR